MLAFSIFVGELHALRVIRSSDASGNTFVSFSLESHPGLLAAQTPPPMWASGELGGSTLVMCALSVSFCGIDRSHTHDNVVAGLRVSPQV